MGIGHGRLGLVGNLRFTLPVPVINVLGQSLQVCKCRRLSNVSDLVLDAIRESSVELVPDCVFFPKDLSSQLVKVDNICNIRNLDSASPTGSKGPKLVLSSSEKAS